MEVLSVQAHPHCYRESWRSTQAALTHSVQHNRRPEASVRGGLLSWLGLVVGGFPFLLGYACVFPEVHCRKWLWYMVTVTATSVFLLHVLEQWSPDLFVLSSTLPEIATSCHLLCAGLPPRHQHLRHQAVFTMHFCQIPKPTPQLHHNS